MNTNNNCNKEDYSMDDLAVAMDKLGGSGKRDTDNISDDELFKQPPPNKDCPICNLLLPALSSGSAYYACCGKMICCGCGFAPVYDNLGNAIIERKCPFCRTPVNKSSEDYNGGLQKRAVLNDALAIFTLGCYYRHGKDGFPQDMSRHLNYLFGQGTLVMPKPIAMLVMLTI